MPCYSAGPETTIEQSIFFDFISVLHEAIRFKIYEISSDEIKYFIASEANIEEKWCKACGMLSVSQLSHLDQLDSYLMHLCKDFYYNKDNPGEIERYKREVSRLGFEFIEHESGNFFTTKPIC